MLAAGYTVYPHIFALFIQEVWVLGVVKYEYLLMEKAGDQYVGSCSSCLDHLKKEFAVSPPYFDFTELCEIEKLDSNRQIFQFL